MFLKSNQIKKGLKMFPRPQKWQQVLQHVEFHQIKNILENINLINKHERRNMLRKQNSRLNLVKFKNHTP